MGKLAAVATVLCLTLTACGGHTARKRPPTHAAFVAAANSVCAGVRTRTGRLDGIQALRPPRQDEDLYRHWLKAQADAVAAVKALTDPKRDAKEEGDPQVPLVIADGKADGYARRIGAGACVTMPA